MADLAIAIDADGVVVSDLGITIDRAETASLQMLDNPTNVSSDLASPPQPTPTNLVNLWMTNSIGLRAIRYVGWLRE